MTEQCLIDMNWDQEPLPFVCGTTLVGPHSSMCPGCKKAKPLMLSGYCSLCNQSQGLGILPRNCNSQNQER